MPAPAAPWRRRLAAAAAIAAALFSAGAEAACAGRDLMPALAVEAPADHAALLAAGAAVENGEARLWQVVSPDGAVGHLFGTYHDTTAHETLTPAVNAAFAGARRLVVELDRAELAALRARVAADPGFSLREKPAPPGTVLSEVLRPHQRRAAEAALAARGLTLAKADRLAPWLLFSTLGVPACELQAMGRGAAVLDSRLTASAEARGLTVSGLEDYGTALAAIDALAPRMASAMIVDALVMAPHEEDLRATLMALYADGRIGLLAAAAETFGQRLTGRADDMAEEIAAAFEESVLAGRNRAWVPRLLTHLATDGAFVAVGALHLPGETGLVALLRAEGFTVTPVAEDG